MYMFVCMDVSLYIVYGIEEKKRIVILLSMGMVAGFDFIIMDILQGKSIFFKVCFMDHFYYSYLECLLKCSILSFAKITKIRISAGQVLEIIYTIKFEKHGCTGYWSILCSG